MHSVVYLVRKDFILSYRYLYILIPFLTFMAWGQVGNLLFYVTLPSIFMLITSCTFDMQNGTPRFMASLPVTRVQVVLSKYAGLIPFTLFGLACAVVFQLVTHLVSPGSTAFGVQEAAAVVILNVAISSLYLPLYFWLGPKGMQMVRLVFIMIVAIGGGTAGTLIKESPMMQHWISGQIAGANTLIAGVGAAVLVLLVGSMLVSFRLYQRQEIQ